VARAVLDGSETEAFTWVTSALIAGVAAGSAAGGALISSGGVGAPFLLACLSILLAATAAVASRRRFLELA
jgi:predicted MFS family arabinose efflux permease